MKTPKTPMREIIYDTETMLNYCFPNQPAKQKGNAMTRKHFQAIAQALKDSQAPINVCSAIASQLSQFNGQFNKDKFMTACGH